MMTDLFRAVVDGLLLFIGLGLLGLAARLSSLAEWRGRLVTYAVTFPAGLDPDDVARFLSGCRGLVAPWWLRPVVVRGFGLEVVATAEGIAHYLHVPEQHAPVVLAALRSAVPAARTARVGLVLPRPRLAVQLALSGGGRVLADGASVHVSSALLSTLQPLGAGEIVRLQWLLSPVGPVAVPRVTAPRRSGGRGALAAGLERLLAGRPLDAAGLADWKRKHAGAVFVATGRIGITAGGLGRARLLRGRVLAALHTADMPGAHLYRSWWPSRFVAEALDERRPPVLLYPAILNAGELSGLLAVPLGPVVLPGVTASRTRLLAPARDIPSQGRVIGRGTFPGSERPLALSLPDSLRHLHIVGPTGSGKSNLLLNLITQDMQAGRGVVVIEPKGDLVADVLDRVPAERVGDVIVLDPADELRPVGLNLLARPGDSPELVVDQVVGIWKDLYRDSWGPRTDDVLRSALLTLVGVPGMTLAEVPLLLADPGFRRPLVARVTDPVALGPFWGWFDNLSEAERAQVIAPITNKLRTVLLRRRLRNVVGQAAPAFDFDRALAERAIILVPLSKGLLGGDAAALLGSLVVTRLWQAVQGRAALPQAERPFTAAHIDEFGDYLRAEIGIEGMLTQARALGLSLTLAHQHLGQLPKGVKDAVLANTRSKVIFQVAASDAAALARELGSGVTAADLQGLGRWEVVASLSAGARVAPPTTALTLPPPPVTGQAAVARRRSRERYGADRSEIEAAIQARHTAPRAPAATARRRTS